MFVRLQCSDHLPDPKSTAAQTLTVSRLTSTPEKDFEAAKSAAKDVEEGNVDYKKEAEEAKDDIVKAAQNKWVLLTLGVGTLFGIAEGFLHGPF